MKTANVVLIYKSGAEDMFSEIRTQILITMRHMV